MTKNNILNAPNDIGYALRNVYISCSDVTYVWVIDQLPVGYLMIIIIRHFHKIRKV